MAMHLTQELRQQLRKLMRENDELTTEEVVQYWNRHHAVEHWVNVNYVQDIRKQEITNDPSPAEIKRMAAKIRKERIERERD